MQPHRLLFAPLLHLLYLCAYFPQLSLSACIYNESYIYVTTTHYTAYNGVYIRNMSRGLLTQNPEGVFLPPNCGEANPDYDGTYIYETQSAPRYYLWMFHDTNGNGLRIGPEICHAATDVFETLTTETSAFLDGTNCVWSDIDSANVDWRYKDPENGWGDINGTLTLCDATESCFTPLPTAYPTLSPVPTTAIPSESPTTADPTTAPTEPSLSPSKYPTKSPTTKPTQLPTPTKPLFLEPPCVAMTVLNLDKAYPLQAAYAERFNEIEGVTYNQRRVWSNGANRLEIFYTDRYEPNRWVISNGTYHLINDGDHLVDGGVNHSFPAWDTYKGHGLYDHFPNNNPHKLATVKYTLQFTCQNTSTHGTRFPTESPTPLPTIVPSAAPSFTPTSAPTSAPTITCGTLIFKWDKDSDPPNDVITNCDATAQFDSDQFLAQQRETLNNHSRWRNYVHRRDEHLFYSVLWEGWIFSMKGETGNVGDHAVYIEAPIGLEMPPKHGRWSYFNHGDIYTPHCWVDVSLSCLPLEPTKTPSSDDPTESPSAAPSDAPTYSPSAAPTQPPSSSPSQPPSLAPTYAPTLLCGGLEVEIDGDLEEDYEAFYMGSYRRQDVDDLKNEKFWWQSIHEPGSTIFYSDIIMHESWVIQSVAADTYWLYPEYNPYSHWLQPPLFGMWHYYTPMSPFPVERRNITLQCTHSLLPTPAPSLAPSNTPTQPPSNAPSVAPSIAPSIAPSTAPSIAPTVAPTTPNPSNAPSNAPSLAPSSPPTREACAWMQVRTENAELDEYNGIYDEIIGGRNGFGAWVMANINGIYIIEKTGNELYWSINKQDAATSLSINDVVTMENAYNWRPPEYADWLFWKIRPNPTTAPTEPTFAPTYDPTVEPTLHPTMDPTRDPTRDPTSDPTNDPSGDPTTDPTNDPTVDPTGDPTMEPTMPTSGPSRHPTQEPTFEPTMEPSMPTEIPTKGPTLEPTESPSPAPTVPTFIPTHDPTIEPTLPTDIPSASPTFEPTVEPTSEPTVPTIGRRRRDLLQSDPPQGTQVYGTTYKIEMDCVNTGSPTLNPTTGAPTMAPTSSCHSLQITSDVSDDIFPYNGEYIRATYAINGLYWFISYDRRSSLQYLHGAWRLQREDRDDGNDEDTILIYRNETAPDPLKWLRLSPQNMEWYAVYHDTDISISIHCLDSAPPTPAPTFSPSSAPTTETEPVWMQCKRNWFTFINPNDLDVENTTNHHGVYWDVPRAYGEDRLEVKVEMVENASYNIQQGDEADFGVYSIVYRATNIYNPLDTDPLFSDCEIKLYVIGNTRLGTTDYCFESKRAVHFAFNETYQEVTIDNGEDGSSDGGNDDDDSDDDSGDDDSNNAEIEYHVTEIININGFATNPEIADEINCYVFAEQITNLTVTITEDEGPTKTFLGIETDALIWDALIAVLCCCICALCLFRIRSYYKACKEGRGGSESKTALLNEDMERERVASAEIDDDDDDVVSDIEARGGPGSSRHIIKSKRNDGELLQEEPGREEYKPPAMLSEGDGAIERNETAGADDPAINALIGEAFESDPVLVTPGPHHKSGGDIEMESQADAEEAPPPRDPPPLGIRQSTFDTGRSLPDEPVPSDPDLYQSDPVLVTPDDANHLQPIVPVPSKVPPPVPDEDEEDYEYEEEEEEEDNAPHQAYQAVPDAAMVPDEPVAVQQEPRRVASNDEYEELEDSDDESEFEFRV